MLVDQNCRFLGRLSSHSSSGQIASEAFAEVVDRQRTYGYFLIGLVKGALVNLGVGCEEVLMINDVGMSDPQLPFELQLRVVLPVVAALASNN